VLLPSATYYSHRISISSRYSIDIYFKQEFIIINSVSGPDYFSFWVIKTRQKWLLRLYFEVLELLDILDMPFLMKHVYNCCLKNNIIKVLDKSSRFTFSFLLYTLVAIHVSLVPCQYGVSTVLVRC